MDVGNRGRPKRIPIEESIINDMCVKGVNNEMRADRVEWKNKTSCADLTDKL